MAERAVHNELESMGFTLVRESPHLIYRHNNGAQLAMAKTPSEWRSIKNTLAQAAVLAGVSKQGQEAREGERRRKKRGVAPAAVDPRANDAPALSFSRYAPEAPSQRVSVERMIAVTVEDGEVERRTVPVQIRNLSNRPPVPKPLPRVPAAHKRAVDALPRGMRERVLKLAKGDYTRIKILADNRVEVLQR